MWRTTGRAPSRALPGALVRAPRFLRALLRALSGALLEGFPVLGSLAGRQTLNTRLSRTSLKFPGPLPSNLSDCSWVAHTFSLGCSLPSCTSFPAKNLDNGDPQALKAGKMCRIAEEFPHNTPPKSNKRCFLNGVFQIPLHGLQQRKGSFGRDKECLKI